MESIVGCGTENPISIPPPTQDKTRVMSRIIQCEKSGAYVAALIFPDNTRTPNRLEDIGEGIGKRIPRFKPCNYLFSH